MKQTPVCFRGIVSEEMEIYDASVLALYREKIAWYWPAFKLVDTADCDGTQPYEIVTEIGPRQFEFSREIEKEKVEEEEEFENKNKKGRKEKKKRKHRTVYFEVFTSSVRVNFRSAIKDRNGTEVLLVYDTFQESNVERYEIDRPQGTEDILIQGLVIDPLVSKLQGEPLTFFKPPKPEKLSEHGVSVRYPDPPDARRVVSMAARRMGRAMPGPDCDKEGYWQCFVVMFRAGI